MILLENERVLLRELTASDYPHLLPFALTEPDTWQYSLVSAAGAEPMQHYIDTAIAAQTAGNEMPFIVYDKQAAAYAGCTRLYTINRVHSTVSLGYTWYGAAFRQTGLNRHCKLLLLTYTFETLGFERVEFRADVHNARSIAAMKAIGCVEEGVLRSDRAKDNERCSSIVLSILREEWLHGGKEKLIAKIVYP